MSEGETTVNDEVNHVRWLPMTAAIIALVGVADSVYLTAHHYTAEPVPCSIIEGCEQVLTSGYAEIAGFPLAAFGAAAYFAAFSLALLTAFGYRSLWGLYGIQATIMAIFSVWLIYIQCIVVGAFCQFCLLSAAASFTLFILYLFSRYLQPKSTA